MSDIHKSRNIFTFQKSLSAHFQRFQSLAIEVFKRSQIYFKRCQIWTIIEKFAEIFAVNRFEALQLFSILLREFQEMIHMIWVFMKIIKHFEIFQFLAI